MKSGKSVRSGLKHAGRAAYTGCRNVKGRRGDDTVRGDAAFRTQRAVLLSVAMTVILAMCHCAGQETNNAAQPTTSPPSGESRSFKVLTYNVFGDFARAEERVPALLALIRDSDADVIALQEVAPWFFHNLMKEPRIAQNYHATMIGGKFVVARGLFILSRRPIQKSVYKRLPGKQERDVLVARMSVHGRSMLVGAVHLESPLEAGPTRAEQLDIAFALLKDADDAILLGDFNFGDGEAPETSHLEQSFTDTWIALKPDDPGFTWNIEKSEMARQESFPGERSRRIDRVLVRSNVWRARSTRIIGDKPVIPGRPDLFPSDHFGLVTLLEWTDP